MGCRRATRPAVPRPPDVQLLVHAGKLTSTAGPHRQEQILVRPNGDSPAAHRRESRPLACEFFRLTPVDASTPPR
jgi:hypothetical protein